MKRPKLSELTRGTIRYELEPGCRDKVLAKVMAVADNHRRSHLHEVTVAPLERWHGTPGYEDGVCSLLSGYGVVTGVTIRHRYRKV